jgi:hypothetical protein
MYTAKDVVPMPIVLEKSQSYIYVRSIVKHVENTIDKYLD